MVHCQEIGLSLLPEGLELGKCFFGIALGFLQYGVPEGFKRADAAAALHQSVASGKPLLELAVADEITASALNMNPKDVVPFFPVEDALWADFQVLGELTKGDDEGLGVDAVAYC